MEENFIVLFLTTCLAFTTNAQTNTLVNLLPTWGWASFQYTWDSGFSADRTLLVGSAEFVSLHCAQRAVGTV
jgi:hypothetical protein